MKKYSTAGVYSTETDISEITQPVGTSTGGIVIRSKKGAINRIVSITDDKNYIDTFGAPVFTSGTIASTAGKLIPEYGYGSYAALEFLKESNALNVMRVAHSDDNFASVIFTSAGAPTTSGISAETSFTIMDKIDQIATLDNVPLDTDEALIVGFVGPGSDGNNVAAGIEFMSSAADWRYQYDDYSSAMSDMTIANKVFKISVYTKKETETWTVNSTTAFNYIVQEDFYGTTTREKDADGNSLFIEDVINGNSNYIYIKVNPLSLEFDLDNVPQIVDDDGYNRKFKYSPLGDGSSKDVHTGIGNVDGWDFFKYKENVDVNILICPDYSTNVKQKVGDVANYRKNVIGVVQAGEYNDDSVNEILDQEVFGYSSPSHIAPFCGWSKVFDSYNDRYVYVPNAIMGAMLMARTDNVANVWDAPAGTDRGIIQAIDQNINLNKAQIGLLYDKNINSVRKMVQGYVMWGQKTAYMKKSKLSRINVRRLLNFIEQTMEESLEQYVLNINNNAKERLRVWTNLDGFLSGVQAEGGLNTDFGPGYQIICDTSNNTAPVIDNGELRIDVYVKPITVVEFIKLQTIVTASGISFSEII